MTEQDKVKQQNSDGMIPFRVDEAFEKLSQKEQKQAVSSFLSQNIIKPVVVTSDVCDEVEERPTRTHLATAHEMPTTSVNDDISRKGRTIHQPMKQGHKSQCGGTINTGGRMIRN